jgi:hypothetical protein
MYELGDGGCLAFFQFANSQFSEQFAPPPPFSLFRHFAMLVTSEQQEAIRTRAEDAGLVGQCDVPIGLGSEPNHSSRSQHADGNHT